MYLQYGCGLSAPEGWRNFDASPTLRLQRLPVLGPAFRRGGVVFPSNVEYGDVTKGLPVGDQTCDAVYCSHVLEHLALDDFRLALKETYRVLRPGGVFRLVLPDLERLTKQYVDSDAPDAAIQFVRDTLLGLEERPRSLRGFMRAWLGNSGHRWMWDYRSLAHELSLAGFTNIRKAEHGDSADPKFKSVESRTRWIGSLGIECRKPARGAPA